MDLSKFCILKIYLFGEKRANQKGGFAIVPIYRSQTECRNGNIPQVGYPKRKQDLQYFPSREANQNAGFAIFK